MSITHLVLLLALAAPRTAGGPQDPGDQPSGDRASGPALLAATNLPPETPADAREAWDRFLASTYVGLAAAAVEALRFDVEVLQRSSAGSTEANLTLEFLSPHYVHVLMKSGREQGRGPGATSLRTRDWFREKGRVVDLVGREYKSDREDLDRMATLCSNFLALANPGRLRLERVELVGPPQGTREGRTVARRLQWLSFESPDFHLPGARRTYEGEPLPKYRVLLGLDPQSGAVRRAQVTGIAGTATAEVAPVFLAFDRHAPMSGMTLPQEIRLYEVQDFVGPRFVDRASVEVYVLRGELGPSLQPTDFLPG